MRTEQKEAAHLYELLLILDIVQETDDLNYPVFLSKHWGQPHKDYG